MKSLPHGTSIINDGSDHNNPQNLQKLYHNDRAFKNLKMCSYVTQGAFNDHKEDYVTHFMSEQVVSIESAPITCTCKKKMRLKTKNTNHNKAKKKITVKAPLKTIIMYVEDNLRWTQKTGFKKMVERDWMALTCREKKSLFDTS